MITKTIYIADDGREFTDKEACVDYEAKITDSVKMYKAGGKTNVVADAMAVKLRDDGARLFYMMSDMEGCGVEGVNVNDEGVFVWVDYLNRYVFLDDDVMSALEEMIDDEKEEG